MSDEYLRDSTWLKVQITIIASYGIISMGKTLTRLGSLNEYRSLTGWQRSPTAIKSINHSMESMWDFGCPHHH